VISYYCPTIQSVAQAGCTSVGGEWAAASTTCSTGGGDAGGTGGGDAGGTGGDAG
jgi:hypothetical protein